MPTILLSLVSSGALKWISILILVFGLIGGMYSKHRQIVEQDIWPISTAASFDPFFQAHGIYPGIAGINNLATAGNISVYPSPANEQINISVVGKALMPYKLWKVCGPPISLP